MRCTRYNNNTQRNNNARYNVGFDIKIDVKIHSDVIHIIYSTLENIVASMKID